MLKDTTFEFEKKRNEPLVYNRNLYVTTIAAMQRINEIKEKREILFWENRFFRLSPNFLLNHRFFRMKAANLKKQDFIQKELQKNVDLISEPTIKSKIKLNILEKEEEEKTKAYAKNLFSKKKTNKIDLEENEDDEEL